MATTPSTVNRWFILGTVMVGSFLSSLDMTATNIAIPSIMTSFGANVQQVQWVRTSTMLTGAAAMPATGWLARRIGYGPLFMAALLLFILGSALSASSWNLQSLIFGRVVQAIGAGSIQPTSMAILTRTFPTGERGRAIGIWGFGHMMGPMLGPTTGGLMIEWFGWRSIYLINVPLGSLMVLVTSVTLPRDRDARDLPFDFRGYLAFATFIIVFLLTVDQGNKLGWGHTYIQLGVALAIASLLFFIALEWDSPHPVMPFRLFQYRDFVLALFLNLFRALGLWGASFLVPLFLQQVTGRTPMQTGLLMLPAAITVAVVMPFSGSLTDRFGGRVPATLGFVLSSWAMYQFTAIDFLTPTWVIVMAQVTRGLAQGFIVTPSTTTGMNAIPREDAGYGSWMLQLSQRYGGAFAIAMLSMFLHSRTTVHMDRLGDSRLMEAGPDPTLVAQATHLGYSRMDADSAALAMARRQVRSAASTFAYQNIFYGLSLIALLGIIPAMMIARKRPRTFGAAAVRSPARA